MTADAWRRLWLILAGLNGVAAVGFGAYAAHGLPDAPGAARFVDTASRYQIYHALALLAVACLPRPGGRFVALAGGLFAAGCVLFSGSLYVMALTGLPSVRLVPLGGLAFVLGWFCIVLAAVTDRPPRI
jgi:uncharacterized membrane protein YgdD (TMEM256/DUF423 family)